MAVSLAERSEQLRKERELLVKAEADIEEGWTRLRTQEDRVREMQGGGHDTRLAQKLVSTLRQTLIEWERHRALIEQRVVYLKGQVDLAQPKAD